MIARLILNLIIGVRHSILKLLYYDSYPRYGMSLSP